jgi:hypothetical protein
MQLIQTNVQSYTPSAPMIGDHAILVANAVRVWTDRRGKTHFEYGTVAATRDPQTCSHQGTFVVHGQRRPYTWARSATFHLRCGDCGVVL